MHLPDHLYRSILSLYRAQGDLPLSPSFVAYELEISTAQAEECLDNLVRESLLEFDFDQDGEIFYRPGSAYRFEEAEDAHVDPARRRAPEADVWGAPDPYRDAASQHISVSRDAADGFAGAADGFAGAPVATARRRAGRTRSAHHFDGDTATALATPAAPKRRPRATAGMREYIPPAPARRSSSRQRSRRPSAARHQRHPHEPRPREAWAEIGPNGYDGCVENAPSQPAPRPPARATDSPWSEHRRFAGLNPEASTDLVPANDDRLPARRKRGADPLLASFLSLIFVGGGQLYNGELAKGVGFIVTFIALWAFGLGWIVHIWAAADAYQIAASRREAT